MPFTKLLKGDQVLTSKEKLMHHNHKLSVYSRDHFRQAIDIPTQMKESETKQRNTINAVDPAIGPYITSKSPII